MSEPVFQHTSDTSGEEAAVRLQSGHIVLDGRYPIILDHRGQLLQIASGHVDIFAVAIGEAGNGGIRRHLFRVETGEIIPDLQTSVDMSGKQLRLIAVSGPNAEGFIISRSDIESTERVSAWITKLAGLIADRNPNWKVHELAVDSPDEMSPGDRRRGPMRGIVWVTLESGSATLMGLGPEFSAGGPPMPLTSGTWIEAGHSGCAVVAGRGGPGADVLWSALDQFHSSVVAGIGDHLLRDTRQETQRLIGRGELSASQTLEAFDRLSAIVVRRTDGVGWEADHADPLLSACRIVGQAVHTPLEASRRPATQPRQDFDAVVEIARTARLRVRQTLLRGKWWQLDAGPLVAWRGTERNPVALIRGRGRRYTMVEADARRPVDRSLAAELSPEAATFYPSLPSRPLKFRDLLLFSMRNSRGNISRITVAVIVIGLLSLVTPLLTRVIVNSIIPRTEFDQLAFCAFALAVTAFATASMQAMEAFAMLRIEAMIDWKLQAAMIDRLLRLPASVFREFTVGDFVDRSMGIDAARRILTGRALRGVMAGLFCLFSIALMLYYDLRLASIAIALTLVRAIAIIAASVVRLYHETKNFNLQGKISGFVLQLLAGIGKLRVAAATDRALAIWSGQFAIQKRHFIASQHAANLLNVFETSFPTLATLIIFAAASIAESKLLLDIGAFLAFFAAFGQSMASIGAWATGMSESLIAIPPLLRLRPLISNAAEISEDRKPPGDLSGAVEFSRLSFRYLSNGPPVLDNVTLKIAPGEYVALVGPSGSGKSSLFRLALGFERPESGAVFFDGRAIDTLDVSAVRRQLGVVLQNARLSTGSIYDNICGGVRLPLEQAWEAARLACIDTDIKAMPMGMHTVISEGVNTLSGGQRQRIMIARAVARHPRILLFDEATSSLDNQSQTIVSAALAELNVTRIVIAHRLSTVRRADRIVMLVDGRIVQMGSYEELCNAPGMFASFAQRQLL
jgi:NHLM bacteriocin system ABC transporter ATP-binding protein